MTRQSTASAARREVVPAPSGDDGFLKLGNRILGWPGVSLNAAVVWSAIRDLSSFLGPRFGMQKICNRCGGKLTRRQVNRAIKELEAAGLLVVDRSNAKLAGPLERRRNTYNIFSPWSQQGENGAVATKAKRVEIRPVSDPEREENSAVYSAKTDLSNSAKTALKQEQKEHKNSSSNPAMPDASGDGQIGRLLLLDAGLNEEAARRHAATRDLDLIAAVIAVVGERSNLDRPAGFINKVLAAPEKYPDLELTERAEAERIKREKSAGDQQAMATESELRQFVASLPDDERQGYYPALVARIRNSNPSASPAYQRQIAQDIARADWKSTNSHNPNRPEKGWVIMLYEIANAAQSAKVLARAS